MLYPLSYYLFYRLNNLYQVLFSAFIILIISSLGFLVKKSSENKAVINFTSMSKSYFSTLFSIAFICFSPSSSIAFVFVFFKSFSEMLFLLFHFGHKMVCLCLQDSSRQIVSKIYKIWKLSWIFFLPNNSTDIFVTSLLISCCSFSFLILLSTAMKSFYILIKGLCLKHQ